MNTRPFWRSLRGRIVLLFLGLLLAVQGMGFWLTRLGVLDSARLQLAERLARSEALLLDQLERSGQQLSAAAATLGADFGLLSTLQGEVDAETVRSTLQDKLLRLPGTGLAAVLDRRGQVLAVVALQPPLRTAGSAAAGAEAVSPASDGAGTTIPAPAGAGASNQATAAAGRSHPAPAPAGPSQPAPAVAGPSQPAPAVAGWLGPAQQVAPGQPWLGRVAAQPHQFVRVPIGQRGEAPSGWLVAGRALAAQLPELARLTQAQITLVVPTEAGAKPAASTLPTGTQPAEQALAPLLALQDGLHELALPGGLSEARQLTLPTADGQALRWVLSLSIDEAVQPFKALQRNLLLVSLLGVGLFAAGSLLMARRVTAPVQALVQASRRLGRGDFETPVPRTARDDELAELAQAFDTMRSGIAERTEHIRRLAYWDDLTGLPNRGQFVEQLQGLLAGGSPLAVLLLNLDRLERVNQVLGRAAGDLVLRQAGQRLHDLALALPEAPAAMVARLGGDEFALLLPSADEARAQAVARQLRQAFTDHPVRLEASVVDLSAPIGVALAPAHADRVEQLMARALLAMTEAKRRMAEVLVYEPSIDAGSAQTLSLLGELRRALREQELRLHLQPKLSLASGRVCGAEALVRWQHPQRGLVPPVQFIPFAEETGFIHELTLWVIDEVARQSARLAAQGLDLRLSVNLSAHDLMKPDLLARLKACLARHGRPAQALCLEITESAIAHDPVRALQTLQALKAEGFKLSIDDFGAGQTSLAQLIDLPVDELKLDMLFVRTMDQNADKASMVGSLVRLGHDRGLSVVAEGVENAAILAQLQQMGCDEAQGWHIGKPMPADALPDWLRARSPAQAADGTAPPNAASAAPAGIAVSDISAISASKARSPAEVA